MEQVCFVCQDTCTIKTCATCTVSYLHRQCLQSLLENGFDCCPGCSVNYCLDTLPTLDSIPLEPIQENGDRITPVQENDDQIIPSRRTPTRGRTIRRLEALQRDRAFARWAGRVAPALAKIFKMHQEAINDNTELSICMEAMLMSITSSHSYLESFRYYLRKATKRIYQNHRRTERMVERDISYMHAVCADCSRWNALAPLFEKKVKRCMKKTRTSPVRLQGN